MKVDERSDNISDYKRKVRNVLIGAAVLLLISVAGALSGSDTMRNLFGFATVLVLLNFFILRPLSFMFQNGALPRLERGYDKFISWVLESWKPYLIFFGSFVLLAVVGTLISKFPPKIEFFPSAEPIYVNTFVELPMGVDIKTTNEIVKEVEEDITKVLEGKDQVVEAVLTQIGENTSDPNEPPAPGVTPNKARITVTFVPTSERGGVSTKEIMNDIRSEVIGKYSGVQINVAKNADGPPAGKPINLEIKGEDIDSLIVLSR